MAHITGGGHHRQRARACCRRAAGPWCGRALGRLRRRCSALLQEAGRVDDAEMFRTFNMGIGFVIVVPARRRRRRAARLTAAGEEVFVLGEIVAGERGVELIT